MSSLNIIQFYQNQMLSFNEITLTNYGQRNFKEAQIDFIVKLPKTINAN